MDSARRGASRRRGPDTTKRDSCPSPASSGRIASPTTVFSSAPSQLSRVSTSWARASASSRASKAARAASASSPSSPRRDCMAIDWTVARVFFTRWFSSLMSRRRCSSARLASVTSTLHPVKPRKVPWSSRRGTPSQRSQRISPLRSTTRISAWNGCRCSNASWNVAWKAGRSGGCTIDSQPPPAISAAGRPNKWSKCILAKTTFAVSSVIQISAGAESAMWRKRASLSRKAARPRWVSASARSRSSLRVRSRSEASESTSARRRISWIGEAIRGIACPRARAGPVAASWRRGFETRDHRWTASTEEVASTRRPKPPKAQIQRRSRASTSSRGMLAPTVQPLSRERASTTVTGLKSRSRPSQTPGVPVAVWRRVASRGFPTTPGISGRRASTTLSRSETPVTQPRICSRARMPAMRLRGTEKLRMKAGVSSIRTGTATA